ncbi:MAG: protein-(glutamine-N5) methyltransferase, release factor-specific [Gammaproteobacteria bacterium RIFCSPHIGHO2_12_FULL_41_15]|nr:MAG: protein-(glutamine-N5) methyltransferase, release factor-specific [Gammaproteobacteria bacterium RIFCSPHIGHO2_12_FULL_41_15]
MTLQELLKQIQNKLSITSQTPKLDAEIIINAALQASPTIFYTDSQRNITESELKRVHALLQRRQQGEPIAYLLSEKEFWSLKLEVTPDTLIPRPETEHLIEWALTYLPNNKPLKIADLGTGSGAIAIALAHEQPNWQLHATDESFAALKVAIRNAQRFNLQNISFYQGDWFSALPQIKFDAIFSNPPYIAEQDPYLNAPEMRFEPKRALIAGTEGLDALQIIINNATHYLQEQGWLIVEHGYDQANRIDALFDQAGFSQIKTLHDLAEIPRFTVGQSKSATPVKR